MPKPMTNDKPQSKYDQVKAWKLANPEKVKGQGQRRYQRQRADLHHGRKVQHLRTISQRAKRLGVPFDMGISSLFYPKHCPILGMQLDYATKGNKAWNAPHVDRIVPELGYVRDNVCVISRRANVIKGSRTRDDLIRELESWETSTLARWCHRWEVEALVGRWPEVVYEQPEGEPLEHV